MSLLPKPKPIKLPFSSRLPREPPKSTCGICELKQSKYICPRCNVLYCSLDCFRSETHSQCSEPFYQSSIRDAIAADPKATNEDKRGMMEMLKRFEDGQAELEGLRDAEGEDGEEDEEEGVRELRESLEGVDMDTIDSNTLFHLLPPSHRTAFISLLRDPSSPAAQQMLGEELADLSTEYKRMWWDTADEDEDEGEDEKGSNPPPAKPQPIEEGLVLAIRIPEEVADKLIYNILALTLAYIHLLPPLSVPMLQSLTPSSPLSQSTLTLFSTSLPFLSPSSTTRYPTLRAAWGDIWPGLSQIPEGRASVELLVEHLRTMAGLVRPQVVVGEESGVGLVLADLYSLLGRKGGKKVLFYAAAVRGVGRERWVEVGRELEAEVGRLEEELEEAEEDELGREEGAGVRIDPPALPIPKADPPVAKIVELN